MVNIYEFVCFFLIVVSLLARKYHSMTKYNIDKKKTILFLLYPLVGIILDKLHYFQREQVRQKKYRFMALYPDKNSDEIFIAYVYKKVATVIMILFSMCFICGFISIQEASKQMKEEGKILRPSNETGSRQVDLIVQLQDEEKQAIKNIKLKVKPRQLSEEEIKNRMVYAKEELENSLLGNNKDLQHITETLHFKTCLKGTPVEIIWSSQPSEFITEDGVLCNKYINEPVQVCIKAILNYKEIQKEYSFPIIIMPYKWTWDGKIQDELKNKIREMDQSERCSEFFKLPNQIGSVQLSYSQPSSSRISALLMLGFIMCIAVVFIYEEHFRQAEKARKKQMILDYPEVINKLVLLIGAGMTVKKAWGKMTSEYEQMKKKGHYQKRYVYEEMLMTWNELENGVTEVRAFEHFGRRIKMKGYLKLVTLLLQNLKKGSKGILNLLDMEARQAMEDRKQNAKKLGEEAGTKLLAPMMLLLVIVLFLIMVPAFLSMS